MNYGLIGEHLGHSFSKEIHGLIDNYDYDLMEIQPQNLDVFMCQKSFKGINVTIPYKQAVIPYLDYIDENAKNINAVNTIVNKDGKLYGYNTDFWGMYALIKHNNIELSNKKVLILGTGGTSNTAKAVADYLGSKQILKVSRKQSNETITYTQAQTIHSDAQIIINTTPCGMFPNNDNSPIDLERFDKLEGVIDVIYNPLNTKLVQQAKKRGVKAAGGLYMLVAQAVYAYGFFFDCKADEKMIEPIYKTILHQKQNIVLTGMPASGKTTIGKLLAKKLGREFYDSDERIVENVKMSIPEIFEKYGEKIFRDFEQQAIKELSSKNGVVISTGGGAILRSENVDYMKSNGKVFFLDRPLEFLCPTKNRPTASSVEAISARYQERYPTYCKTADVIIKPVIEKNENVNKVERSFFNEIISD